MVAYSAYSQELPFESYNIDEGLGSSEVFRIHQDNNGYMWFCTDFGLSRFDGKQITQFNLSEGLTSPHVMNITSFPDQNKYWISTFNGGLNIFENGLIRGYSPQHGIIDNQVIKAEYCSENQLLILHGYQRQLSVLKNDTCTNINLSGKYLNSKLLDFQINKDKQIYLLVNHEILINNNGGFEFSELDSLLSGEKLYSIRYQGKSLR